MRSKARRAIAKSTLDPNYFTPKEMQLLMKELPDNRIGTSIKLMLTTGLRVGEVLGLEAKHIEADGSIIHVVQTLLPGNSASQLGPPKSERCRRDVVIPLELQPATKRLREITEQYVWYGESTPICSRSDFQKQYNAEITKIQGVRNLSPHKCRSTFLANHNADPFIV